MYMLKLVRLWVALHSLGYQGQQSCDPPSDRNIQTTTASISELQAELEEQKRIRANREQYEVLAKVINEHPARSETLAYVVTGRVRRPFRPWCSVECPHCCFCTQPHR